VSPSDVLKTGYITTGSRPSLWSRQAALETASQTNDQSIKCRVTNSAAGERTALRWADHHLVYRLVHELQSGELDGHDYNLSVAIEI
jgi:hypothetical protein